MIVCEEGVVTTSTVQGGKWLLRDLALEMKRLGGALGLEVELEPTEGILTGTLEVKISGRREDVEEFQGHFTGLSLRQSLEDGHSL